MKPPEAGVRIRRADLLDVSDIAWVLRQSFLEYQDRYTAEGFAATTPGEQHVRARMAEGPTWVALWNNASVSNVVGTASVVEKDERVLYVRGMAILPAAPGTRDWRIVAAGDRGVRIEKWLRTAVAEYHAISHGRDPSLRAIRI